MKTLTLFLTTFIFMNMVACSAKQDLITPSNHDASNSNNPPKILKTIKNIETFPESSLGNQAMLIKDLNGSCHIEFTGFHQKGKISEKWTFIGNKILAATSTTSLYVDNTVNNQQNSKDILNIKSSHTIPLEITNPEKIQSFSNLKNQFNNIEMEQCHK